VCEDFRGAIAIANLGIVIIRHFIFLALDKGARRDILKTGGHVKNFSINEKSPVLETLKTGDLQSKSGRWQP
jgi:hypothetical protein